jgi:cell division protein FtsQ
MLQATRRTVADAAITVEARALPPINHERLLSLATWLLLLLAAIALIAGLARMSKALQARTHINSVQVEGELRHADSHVIASGIAPLAQGNYFSVDLAAIQKSAESAPWVDEAIVSRRWPDGIRIQIREKQPVALWGAGGLISSRGELFVPPVTTNIATSTATSAATNTTDLPILFGPGNKGTYVMEQYRAMNGILRGIDMRIVELQLTDRMSWFLRLDNGIHLVVDQADTIEKLQRFAYLYGRQLKPDAGNILSIDLRYRNGVAVAWRVVKPQKINAQRV